MKQTCHWIATERKVDRGGGAALMISKNGKIFERKQLNQYDLEAVWGNVYSNDGSSVIGSIYIPPNYSKGLKALFGVVDELRLKPLPIC